jgi:molecular chaperone IbpA
MRTYDFTPLFRSTVGFDRMSRLLESALSADETANSYPPYNIERLDENQYRITMAVAGFSEADIDIVSENQTLTVRSKAKAEPEPENFLYRGIAGRAFERRFQLADHILVTGASMENGLLHIALERQVPEQLKPRSIPIATGGTSAPTIEHSKAA